MKIFRLLLINLLVLSFLLLLMEGLSRIFFSEFNNQTFAPKSLSGGKNIKMSKSFGYDHRTRKRNEKFNYKDKGLVVIVGDSITRGHGLDYEDIYWVEAERIFNLLSKDKIKIFASPNFGSAILNSLDDTKSLIEVLEKEKKIKHFIYQFNYNDITPSIIIRNANEKFFASQSGFAFHAFRYEYLNRSTFLRLLQYYAGALRIKKNGNCEERGLDALWRYSWVYGSKVVEDESKSLWNTFENNLQNLSLFLKDKEIKFSVLIVPTLLQIDPKNKLNKNYLNLDLTCKTIEPTKHLISLLFRNKINYILTDNKIKKVFDSKILNDNKENFFFAGDYNHFNSRASIIVGSSLASHLFLNSD